MDPNGRTLKRYFMQALRRAHASRPMSFYLLLAIIAVLILGTQLIYFREDPQQFALYLSLMLVFFFVVIFRATLDFFDITRRHLKEKREIYRSTLGDRQFAAELGRRIGEASHGQVAPASQSLPEDED